MRYVSDATKMRLYTNCLHESYILRALSASVIYSVQFCFDCRCLGKAMIRASLHVNSVAYLCIRPAVRYGKLKAKFHYAS